MFVGVMVLGGVQLIMIGVVGEYIGKILEETKAGPSTSLPNMMCNCTTRPGQSIRGAQPNERS